MGKEAALFLGYRGSDVRLVDAQVSFYPVSKDGFAGAFAVRSTGAQNTNINILRRI